MPQLKWEDVVEYAFVSEFDLLRQASREDISVKPWATPAGRIALDQHFKEVQARTEIVRLNIEIKRLVTHIRDEDNYLRTAEANVQPQDPVLSFHIAEYRHHQTRFDSIHLSRLSKLASLSGFTGDLTPGIAVSPYSSTAAAQTTFLEAHRDSEDEEEDETDDDEEAVVGKEFIGVIAIATDRDVALDS